MASRRMFAKSITDSDVFLDMPLSTQALYFHLCMNADDDGFVNSPKRIMRAIGSNEDELKLLITKNFAIPFQSGVICITHWRVHNSIKKDRYHASVLPEKNELLLDEKSGVYSLCANCLQDVHKPDTTCLQTGYDHVHNTETECLQNGYSGKDRLGKYSVGETSTVKERIVQDSQEQDSTAGGKGRSGGENPPYHEKNAPLNTSDAKAEQWKRRVRWYTDHYTYSLTEEEQEYIVCEFMECNLLNQTGLDLLGKHAGNKTALFETIKRMKERCNHDLAETENN